MNDVAITALLVLVLVGLAVSAIVLWGRRQQATSAARAGYLDAVAATSHLAAGQLAPDELVAQVTHVLTDLLGVDACRFVTGASRTPPRAVLEPDGSVTVNGTAIRVDRDGLPTMEETALSVRHHGAELGRFMITASTSIVRPGIEQRRVAVLLANLVGSELACPQPLPRSA